MEAADCLERGDSPEAAPDCDRCSYAEKVARFGADMNRADAGAG